MTLAVETSEPRRREDGLSLLAVVIWVVGACFSILAGFVTLRATPVGVGTDWFPWLGAVLHLLASALAFIGTRIAKGDHPSGKGWACLVTFFAFFGGPFGFLAGVACYLFGVGQPTEMPLVDVVKAEMFIRSAPAHRHTESAAFDVQLREELRTQPIVDLLPYADVATAIAIINKLAEQKKPEDLELLRKLSQDRRPEVYQFALSKLDEFDRDYAQRIYHLTEQLGFTPEDVGLRVELAKVYYEYTTSGLLDESLRDYYWEMTLAQLFDCMRLDSNRPELVVDMARMFLLQGMFLEAEAAAEDVLRREPANLNAQLVLLECLCERAQREGNPMLLQQARLRALESAWAIKIPKSKEQHPLFRVADFWFGRSRTPGDKKESPRG